MPVAKIRPEDYVYDLFSEAMYPHDALGRPVLGTPDTVSSFDTDEMHRYHDAHYTTGNITVVACGSVDHAVIVDLAERYLSGLPVGPWLERGPVDAHERVMLSCVKKDSEQANIVLGAPTIVNDDPRRFVYSLLDIIIGGGMSSRLFQEIREKRGLVYSVYASSQLYEGAGIFEMYAGTRPENIAEVVKVATEQFALAAQDGLTADELAVPRSSPPVASCSEPSQRVRACRAWAVWPCSTCPSIPLTRSSKNTVR